MVTSRTTPKGSLTLVLLLLPALALGASTLPTPHAVNYIGIGYNILDGNPEGDNKAAGGVDPGLLVSRRIFHLSYDDGKKSNDNQYRVPDEIEFQHRSSSFTSKQKDTFFGTKSYAKKLSHQVKADLSVEGLFASVKFSASHRYESIKNEASTKGYVYFSEQTIKNFGHMRYKSSLASHDGYEIEREFRIEVCDLPTAYNRDAYMAFISKWGTSVVTECDVGMRSGENYREDRSSFVRDATTDMSNSASVEGNYKIVSGSLSVDMDRYTKSESSEKKFGSKFTSYTIGSEEHNEPIVISLIGLEEALKDDYWSKQADYESSGECPSGWPRATIAANILKGLKEYPDYRGVSPSTDPDVSVKLTWPDGKYGLPATIKVANNQWCPDTDYLTFSNGLFYQNTAKGTRCSKGNHLTNYCSDDNIRNNYCVKTTPKSTTNSWTFTPGVYCIYKYGDSCPDGFDQGSIKWNDGGLQKGLDPLGYDTAPSGVYAIKDTEIEFCCREDGSVSSPIFLPTEKAFYLIQYHEGCQQIHGMTATAEWIEWATRPATPSAYQTGAFPRPGNTGHGVRINFCFYQPKPAKRTFLEQFYQAVREVEEEMEEEELEEERMEELDDLEELERMEELEEQERQEELEELERQEEMEEMERQQEMEEQERMEELEEEERLEELKEQERERALEELERREELKRQQEMEEQERMEEMEEMEEQERLEELKEQERERALEELERLEEMKRQEELEEQRRREELEEKEEEGREMAELDNLVQLVNTLREIAEE